MSYGLGASSAHSIDDFAIEKRAEQILSRFSPQGKHILDVGCGNGLYSFKMAGLARSIVGVDISGEQIAEAHTKKLVLDGDVEFATASAESLPFGDSRFDAVLLIEMLDHVPHHERAVREAWRVVRDGGELVVYVPNKLYLFEVHGMHLGRWHIGGFYHGSIPLLSWAPQFIRRWVEGARIYTTKQIVRLLEENGFAVSHIDYYFPPLSKVGNRAVRTTLGVFFSLLERRAATRRFGMSIFLVARKERGT